MSQTIDGKPKTHRFTEAPAGTYTLAVCTSDPALVLQQLDEQTVDVNYVSRGEVVGKIGEASGFRLSVYGGIETLVCTAEITNTDFVVGTNRWACVQVADFAVLAAL